MLQVICSTIPGGWKLTYGVVGDHEARRPSPPKKVKFSDWYIAKIGVPWDEGKFGSLPHVFVAIENRATSKSCEAVEPAARRP